MAKILSLLHLHPLMWLLHSRHSKEGILDFVHNVNKTVDRANSYVQFRRQIYWCTCLKTAWVETNEMEVVSRDAKVMFFFLWDIFLNIYQYQFVKINMYTMLLYETIFYYDSVDLYTSRFSFFHNILNKIKIKLFLMIFTFCLYSLI